MEALTTPDKAWRCERILGDKQNAQEQGMERMDTSRMKKREDSSPLDTASEDKPIRQQLDM